MASLGQLTAGIAHEIQNPLNFVNNFSEINTELIAELKVEVNKGDLEEVKALSVLETILPRRLFFLGPANETDLQCSMPDLFSPPASFSR